MGCNFIKDEYGRTVAVACTRNRQSKYEKCHFCNKPMTAICDGTHEGGKQCDLPMCDDHRHRVAEDTDVCEYHFSREHVKRAILKREERQEARKYFVEEYVKQDFRVAPGHWPDFSTKEEVDEWIENQNKMMEITKKLFNRMGR